MFVLGTAVFTGASVWCVFAGSVAELIIARGVQGLGGALLVPGSLAIISALFPKAERGPAIGTWAGFSALTTAFGPVLGGWLVDAISWRGVFFVVVPFALAGLSGAELTSRMAVQARKFDARFTVPCRAMALRREGGDFIIDLEGGGSVRGRSVIVATGASYRKLALDRLEALEGAGVYCAATELEAQVCRGEAVLVVGGGNSAGQAAMFLSEHAREVLLLIRGGDLAKSMSRYLVSLCCWRRAGRASSPRVTCGRGRPSASRRLWEKAPSPSSSFTST